MKATAFLTIATASLVRSVASHGGATENETEHGRNQRLLKQIFTTNSPIKWLGRQSPTAASEALRKERTKG